MHRFQTRPSRGSVHATSPLPLRLIGWVLLLVFFVSQTFVVPVGRSDPLRTKTDIVALVVEQGAWDDSTQRADAQTGASLTLRERVQRYAQDIQAKLPWTRTEILLAQRDEPVERIAATLEKLYFEGDERFEGLSQLSGVVLVGDVPLPVVEQDGHLFESVYPYTDFLDKAFLHDASTGIYRAYAQAPRQQAEAWHGVIRAPSGSGDPIIALSGYFDKNHAYYAGLNGYATFDRKVFFADLVSEPSRIGAEGFLPYQLFLEYLEDIVYERYTTRLLRELTDRIQGSMDALLRDNGVDIDSATALKDLSKVPDQYTKQPIEQMLKRFIELMGAYTGEVGDAVAGSGRWTEHDADTFARRITLRDEAGAQAMKTANERLSTFEQPVNLFAIAPTSTTTIADAKAAIDRILTENQLSPSLLTTDGLYDVVAEALVWRTYHIADKYRHILQADLMVPGSNQTASPYAGTGYESAYFVLDPTSRDAIGIPRLRDGLFTDGDDEFDAAKERIANLENSTTTLLSTQQAIGSSGMGAVAAEATKDACGSLDDGVPLPQWFPAIMCWLRNLLPPKISFKNDGRGTQFSLKENRPAPDPVTGDESTNDPSPVPVPGLALAPTFLRVTPQPDTLAVGGVTGTIQVEVLDQRHEAFAYDGPLGLRLTSATSTFGSVVSTSLQVVGGRAQAQVRSSDLAGEMHLIASIDDTVLGVTSIRTYAGESSLGPGNNDLPLNALYVTLAGVDGGARDSSVADKMLYSRGKTQAVTTLIAPERMGHTLLTVGPQGLLPGSGVDLDSSVLVSTSEPLTLHYSDANLATTVADVRFDLPSGKAEIGSRPQGSVGISVEDTSDDDFTFVVQGNDVSIRQDGAPIGLIRADGRMQLPVSLHLEMKDAASGAPGTVLELFSADRAVADIHIATDGLVVNAPVGPAIGGIDVRVPNRSYDVSYSGPYVSVTDPSERSEVRQTFASLNNRSEEQWSGWKGDFINEILFAAGNTVGQAVRHNASSSVVTLGDPVVGLNAIQNEQVVGYGKDVGHVVAEVSDSRIAQVLTADYNRDGLPDILVNREDGELHLYQNYNQGLSYKDMGTLIAFDERVSKLLPIDIDADGWTDLLALKNDGSLTVFMNHSGAFDEAVSPVAPPAPLSLIDSADFDGDGRIDLLGMQQDGALLVWFATGNGFERKPVVVDTLPTTQDVAVVIERPEGIRPNILIPNVQAGKLVRYFPTGNGRTFEKRISDVPPNPADPSTVDANGNGIPDLYETDTNGDGIPDAVEQQVRAAITPQGAGNRSTAFNLGALADSIDKKIDDVMQNLCPKKSGGCPTIFGYNKAFFAPGYSTIVGPLGNSCTQSPFPELGKPVISLPPIVSQFRLYVMPTLTGGVGIAACFGPKFFPAIPPVTLQYLPLLGNCFVRSFNPLTQACSGLSVLYDQLWNSARGIVRGAGGANLFQVGIGAKEEPKQYDNGAYTDKTKKINNVRPKAFPAFIMTWVERQVEEIVTKLTDLPSVTLILPDFSDTFVPKDLKDKGQKPIKDVKYIGDALDYLNSLPFLNIKVEDVNVKYPALPKKQMRLMKEYYEQWIKDAEDELKSFQARADVSDCLKGDVIVTGTGATVGQKCSIAFPKLNLRIAAAERTIQRVQSNLKRLQEYAEFPQTIEKLVNYKTEIIRQTTLYLDRIANYMGGYYLRNKLRVVKWQEMYRLIKEILHGWQLLPDIFTQYRNACTTCRNDRGNYMDCRMTIWKFVLAPVFNNLPIIPFPKWPDIVIDVSNINAVVDIHIPSPHFIPQPVVLPKPKPFRIPDINFETGVGDLLSDQIALGFEKDLDLTIPKLPALPQIPDFLPKLPNLPLPQLPDIPPPPKIPKIAGALTTVLKVAKVVLKVWCLYKKGIPLIPEQNVKGVVEYQTERSNFIRSDFLDVFIPEPKLPYVDQIRVDAFVNFTFNVDALRTAMNKFVQPFNKMVTNLTRSTLPLHQVLDSVPQLPDEIRMGATEDDKRVAQAEMDSYRALLKDTSTMLDVGEFKKYFDEQVRAAQKEEPLFQPDPMDDGQLLADAVIPNERVTALKTTLDGIQRRSDDELRAMRQVMDGDVGFVTQARLAGVEQSDPVEVERGSVREIVPARVLALVDEAAPTDAGGGSGTPNAVWGTDGGTAGALRDAAPQTADSANAATTLANVRDLFLYDPATRQPQRLVAYAGEQNIGSVVDSADLDANGETDIVYNLGSTIMVKLNTRSVLPATHFSDVPPVSRIANGAVETTSVNYVRTTDGYRFSGLFWNYEPNVDRIGYRLTLRKVINAFDRERSEGFASGDTRTAYFAWEETTDRIRQIAERDSRSVRNVTVIDSLSANSAPLSLEPGTYYGRFQSLVATGAGNDVQEGTANELHIVVARTENKAEQPVAVIAGGNYRAVPVLQATTLDGRLSYKTGGSITNYSWDLHPETDTDKDGIPDNDADDPTTLYAPVSVTTPYHQSIITLPAFVEPGPRRIVLTVTDDAGNTAKTEVNVDVFVPKVVLDEVSKEKGLIRGHLDPGVADEPVTLLRDRKGTVTVVKGVQSDANGQLHSDVVGQFALDGLVTGSGLELRAADGTIVASIDPASRQIRLSPRATVSFAPVDASRPTRLEISLGLTKIGWVSLAVAGKPGVLPALSDDVVQGLRLWDAADDSVVAQEVPPTSPSYANGLMLYDRDKKVLYASLSPDGNVTINYPSVAFALQDIDATSRPVTVSLSIGTEIARLVFPWTISSLP